MNDLVWPRAFLQMNRAIFMNILGFPEILSKESIIDKIFNAIKSSKNQASLLKTSQKVYTAKNYC